MWMIGASNYIQLYQGNASRLAESLEVIQQTCSIILYASQQQFLDQEPMLLNDSARFFGIVRRVPLGLSFQKRDFVDLGELFGT